MLLFTFLIFKNTIKSPENIIGDTQNIPNSFPKIIINKSLSFEERQAFRLKLEKLPKNSNPNRVRNRCNLTGRPRSYYRRFGLSRISLREMASNGLIPGVTKASW